MCICFVYYNPPGSDSYTVIISCNPISFVACTTTIASVLLGQWPDLNDYSVGSGILSLLYETNVR